MMIYMSEFRVKSSAKRMRKFMRELGSDSTYMECLNLSAQLVGYDDWEHFRRRDLGVALSPFDDLLPDEEFAARAEFQMGVLAAAGLASIAREMLDRVNPTGFRNTPPTEAAEC
jgi:hypothetical protein